MKSTLHDLNTLASDLADDTRNVLLTYAKIWSTIETNEIRSKPVAADWAIEHLPKIYKPVMERAKSICVGVNYEYWYDLRMILKSCADFMVAEINTQSQLINLEASDIRIKLSDESS